MPMIPCSQTFDQSTMSRMLDADPVVQRYRTFFALFDWSVVPEPAVKPSQPGKRPHPQRAYLKALLLKRQEEFTYCTQLRRFLVEHPLLVLELGFRPVLDVKQAYGFDVKRTVPSARWFREQQRMLEQSVLQSLLAASVQALREEIPGLGEVVAFDVTHIYAYVKENNPRVYVKDRYKKEVQPRGDPDCQLGVKKSSNKEQAQNSAPGAGATPAAKGQEQAKPTGKRSRTPKSAQGAKPSEGKHEEKECLWGYGSGVASATVAGYGDVVLAEYTQPFNENDQTYFVPLYIRTVAATSRLSDPHHRRCGLRCLVQLPNGGLAWGYRGHPAQYARPSRDPIRSRWGAAVRQRAAYASHLSVHPHLRLSRPPFSLSTALSRGHGPDVRPCPVWQRQRLCQRPELGSRWAYACDAGSAGSTLPRRL